MSEVSSQDPSGHARPRFLRALAAVEAVLIVLVSMALLRGERSADAERAPRAIPTVAPRATGEVSAPDEQQARAAQEPVAGATLDPASATATADSVLLFGRVTGSAQTAHMSVAREGGGRVLVVPLFGQACDYAAPGLLPGRYSVRVETSGRRPIEAQVDVPAGVDRVRRDFRLERSWQLKVELATPDGKRLTDELPERLQLHPYFARPFVHATHDPPPAFLPLSDWGQSPVSVGQWVAGINVLADGTPLPKRYAGYLELTELEPLHVSVALRNAVMATERVEAGQDEVKLVVSIEQVKASMCTLRLQVVDAETRRPVPEARVRLSHTLSGLQGQPADAAGRVELTSIYPGLCWLSISVKDRVATSMNVVLEPGAVVDLGEVCVVSPVTMRVKFTGIADETVVNGWLQRLDAPAHPQLRARNVSFHHVQRADGIWSSPTAAGRYLLRATATSGGAGALVEVEARAGAEPIVVAMQPEAKLRVVPPGGGRAIELALVAGSGRDMFRQWINWRSASDLWLPPGAYSAHVTRVDGKREQRAIQVPLAGATLDLRQ